MAKFDFTWFIPAIVKYRKLLGEVLLISLVLQIVGLITPMFFQVVLADDLTEAWIKVFRLLAIQTTNRAEWNEKLWKVAIVGMRVAKYTF